MTRLTTLTHLPQLAALLLALLACLAARPARAAEAPQPLTDDKLAEILKSAPPIPKSPQLDLDLKLKTIDFIDCTNPADPHGFMDQGTSKIVTGPAGKYRITAAHAHAFFGYRFKSAGKDKPILIVFEYPDDADRSICFLTAESGLTGAVNADWSLETGVYTGTPLPLSNKMQHHTFIWWPQDNWPALLVGNWNRAPTGPNSGAACSRIWICSIDAPLPKLQVAEPAPAHPRRLGQYNSIGYYLAQRLYFGLRSPNAIEHMLDYFDYIGVNELSWGVTGSEDSTIPAWGLHGTRLDEVLAAMDKRGDFRFTAALNRDAQRRNALPPDQAKAALFKAYDEFLDRYGKFKSLKGITIGSMYGIEPVDALLKENLAAELVAHIKQKRPDFEVATYLGGRGLHIEYFPPATSVKDSDGGDVPAARGAPTAAGVYTNWETSGKPWSDFLGDQALAAWKSWGRDPAVLRATGLTLYEQLQPDDFRVFTYYGGAQDPRSMMYYDLDRSQRRSDLIASPYAAIWNTHYEAFLGIVKDYNFWYTKAWVAPDFDAPEPLSLAPFANALALRDRQAIIAGSWNCKYFGHEADIRRFAKAFRELPSVEMKDVASPVDSVKVRWAIENGKRYISVLSRIPFASEITIDGNKVALPPYELVTLTDAGTAAPKVTGQPSLEYKDWLQNRIWNFARLSMSIPPFDPAAPAGANYQASMALAAGELYAADLLLSPGLVNEVQLRHDILHRPEIQAPKIAAAPPMNGDLNAWPKNASDIHADTGEFLACHLYFPNSWTGPDDLSARLRLANDGEKLYVGVEVHDQKLLSEKIKLYRGSSKGKEVLHEDSFNIKLSTKAYRDWKAPADGSCKAEINWSVDLPFDKDGGVKGMQTTGIQTTGKGSNGFTYTCHRTATGYVVEGSAPLDSLNLQPGAAGGTIGFLLMVGDYDGTVPPNLQDASWATKQVLLYPHKPNFLYYEDARNLGTLLIDK